MNDRIERLRNESFEAPVMLDHERARIITEFYRENFGKFSVPVTRAMAFRDLCERKSIFIGRDELVVGERGPFPKSVSTYPELNCHSMEDLEILDSREKNRAFANDFCNYLEGMKWFVSDWFLALMRPFWGKSNNEMFRGFVKPLFRVYTEGMKNGDNLVNYDAPLSMYFYGSPYTDPADPVVAATYAMAAGESMGLGTCMLGAIHPLIQNGKRAKQFRERHGIKYTSREGLFVIFGFPSVKYKKGIKRTFASETYN